MAEAGGGGGREEEVTGKMHRRDCRKEEPEEGDGWSHRRELDLWNFSKNLSAPRGKLCGWWKAEEPPAACTLLRN